MITIKQANKNYQHLHQLIKLYKESFPKNERDPINHLLNYDSYNEDLLAFEEDNEFIGFAFIMASKTIAHILYFAINSSIRGKGYGSKTLELIKEKYKDRSIIVDVEQVELAENINQRINRINFYLHNKFIKTDITYSWDDVDYEILCYGKPITKKEFDEFWHEFKYDEDMGKFLYETFKK